MRWLKDNIVYIILIYFNTLFLMRVMEKSYLICSFSYEYITFLFIIGVAIFFLYDKILYTKKYKVLFTAVFIISIGIVYWLQSSSINSIFQKLIVENYLDTDDLIFNMYATNFSQFKPILTLIIPISSAAILWITSKGFTNVILIISTTFMITFWYLGFSAKVKNYLFLFLLLSLITYSLGLYVKHIRKLKKAGIEVLTQYSKLIINITVFSLIVVIVGSFLPKNYHGRMETEIEDKMTSVFQSRNIDDDLADSKNKYSFSYSGFDRNNGKLGGTIHLDGGTAFKVQSDKPYYLIGSIKDYYNGFLWKETGRTFSKQNNNIPIFQEDFSNVFLGEKKSLTIYPVNIKTSTFFIPELSCNIYTKNNNVYYDNIPTCIDKKIVSNYYTVNFYDSTFNRMASNSLGNNEGKSIYGDQFDKYLELPNNITKATKNLAFSITKGSKTNSEKVDKIKKYLQSNYKYSLNVSDVPTGSEFVDDFLFKEKKGYCTYFATAAVILCRIAGIPARYVEGFNMPDIKDNKGLYVVSNNNAHAWCEVLLMSSKNSGLWQVMDCVPGAQESSGDPSSLATVSEDSKPSETPTAEATALPDKPEISDKPSEDIKKAADSTVKISTVKKEGHHDIIFFIVVPSIIILFIVSLLIIIRIMKFKMELKKIFVSESVVPLYNYSKKRLKKINIKKSDNEGDMEFASDIENESLRKNMQDIINLSYSEFYGKKKHSNYDKVQFYDYIEMYIRSRQNIFTYYMSKYIFQN